MADPGCWSCSLASLCEISHADVRRIAIDLSKTNKKSIAKGYNSRVAQGAYQEIEYIRNVLSVSGTSKYADSGTA